MSDSAFRFVCVPSALIGAPAGWAAEMLRDGEIALLADDSGFDGVNDVAHALDLVSVPLMRGEDSLERQEKTVMTYAAAMPLVWVGWQFSEAANQWAHDRGPMTLLVPTPEPLSDDERRRIDRFVASLGRQTE